MADQESLVCTTCGVSYEATLPHCSNCGEANPIITETLFSRYPDIEEDVEEPPVRNRSGCLLTFSFLLFLFIVLGLGALGAYEGFQERIVNTRAEVEKHYQRALAHIENDRLELAKAELELTLTLDPAHTLARDTLASLQTTPTSEAIFFTDNTPTNTIDNLQALFDEARKLTLQGNWSKAIQALTQIRQADTNFQASEISDLLYNANYELGLRLVAERKLTDAITAFDEALVERPDDPIVVAEWEKVTLYLSLNPTEPETFENNALVLERIYDQDPDFVDVADLLYDTYKQWGDYLGGQSDWCAAEEQYKRARSVFSSPRIGEQVAQANQECLKLSTPTPTATKKPTATTRPTATATATRLPPTPTRPRPTATPTPVPKLTGTLYFSRFNQSDSVWEIVTHNFDDSQDTVVLRNGTQPDISPSGTKLVYHSTVGNSTGLHVLDLTTNIDTRATTFDEDVLPSWISNETEFVFSSQRDGDRRWRVFIGFADGKGDAVFVHEGRTGTSSKKDDLIAYQGTDPSGNQPGIYVLNRSSGGPRRVTLDQSDRNPAISPVDGQIAYMSNQAGSWDIWLVDFDTGSEKQLTTDIASDGLPTWSPDGRHVAFVSDRDGQWALYTIDIELETLEFVTTWGGHPDWLLEQIGWAP
ncbi:MAG: hypothetical protein AAF629_16260 [Chloroflexota bacterium]